MARARKSGALGLWMNGQRVGTWVVTAQGEHQLHYDEAWLASPLGRPISLSMPLRPASAPYKGELVRNYFENLLPDNDNIRQRLAKRFSTSTEAFRLLAEIGRDCVGALQIMPDGEAPPASGVIQCEPLSDGQVAEHLAGTLTAPAFTQADDTFRISIAGAQEKTALLWHQERWCRPLDTTPTTHIFKLPMGQMPGGIDLSTSVENEWLCHRLLQAFDIPVAKAEIVRFGDMKALCVERFDRRWTADGRLLRLPQEDFAQVFGVPPDIKYESQGGPGIRAILDQLKGSSQAPIDRRDFFRTQVLFWMLAAIDGHAKNFSIFIEPKGFYRLTPRYDVLSAHPVMGQGAGRLSSHKVKMAMAIDGKNRHYKWSEIRRDHFEQTALHCRLPDAPALIDELVSGTPRAIAEVADGLPSDFPENLAGALFEGLKQAANALRLPSNPA
ncbi:MAG: toxin HipA [Rhodocyclaceae bacterium]|nr:toxin HipA [Rhodocyclaceae bacterium]